MGIDRLYMDQYVETGWKRYIPKVAKTTTGTGSVGSKFVNRLNEFLLLFLGQTRYPGTDYVPFTQQ